ncbi:hypothetical protein [Nostoc sp.]
MKVKLDKFRSVAIIHMSKILTQSPNETANFLFNSGIHGWNIESLNIPPAYHLGKEITITIKPQTLKHLEELSSEEGIPVLDLINDVLLNQIRCFFVEFALDDEDPSVFLDYGIRRDGGMFVFTSYPRYYERKVTTSQ